MEIEVNGKTLSINHYVNYKLKPKKIKDGGLMFPIYSQIVYESKNTKFKSFNAISDTLFSRVKEGEDLDENTLYERFLDLKDLDSLIISLVENEILEKKDNFTLKGFSKRIKIYLSLVNDFIPDAIYDRLVFHLGDKFSFNDFVTTFKGADTIYDVLDILTKKYDNIIDEMPLRLQAAIRVYQIFEILKEQEEFNIKCYEWMQKKKEVSTRMMNEILKIDSEFKEASLKEMLTIVDDLIYEELKKTEIN